MVDLNYTLLIIAVAVATALLTGFVWHGISFFRVRLNFEKIKMLCNMGYVYKYGYRDTYPVEAIIGDGFWVSKSGDKIITSKLFKSLSKRQLAKYAKEENDVH